VEHADARTEFAAWGAEIRSSCKSRPRTRRIEYLHPTPQPDECPVRHARRVVQIGVQIKVDEAGPLIACGNDAREGSDTDSAVSANYDRQLLFAERPRDSVRDAPATPTTSSRSGQRVGPRPWLVRHAIAQVDGPRAEGPRLDQLEIEPALALRVEGDA